MPEPDRMTQNPNPEAAGRPRYEDSEESKGLRATEGLKGSGNPSDTAERGNERPAPSGEG